jgi:hypothetical protein
MNLRSLLPLFLLPFLSLTTEAQNKIMVRFAAQSLPAEMPQIVMRSGEEKSPPFEISAEFFSQPQPAIARTFVLQVFESEASLARVQLPEKGGRFIVLLVLASGGKLSPVVIPDDRSTFRGGDVHAHNSSGKTVLGILGTTKFRLPPGVGGKVRPAGIVDEQYYEVRFAYQDGDASRMFSSARWPAGLKERCYVFFYTDHQNPDRVLYRVIGEVLLPDVQ